jgi:hypothetical protein
MAFGKETLMQHIEGLLVKGGMDMLTRTVRELGREVTDGMAWELARRFADEYGKFTDSLIIMDSRGKYDDIYKMLWQCAYTANYTNSFIRELVWSSWGKGDRMEDVYRDSLVYSVLGKPAAAFVLAYTEAQFMREGVDGRGQTCLTAARVEITTYGEWIVIHTGDERITRVFHNAVKASEGCGSNGAYVTEGKLDLPDGAATLSVDIYMPGMAMEVVRKVLGGSKDAPAWWPPFSSREVRSSGLAASWLYMEWVNTEDNPRLDGLPAFLRALFHGGVVDDITRRKYKMLCDEFYGLIADIPARDGRRQNDPLWVMERTRFMETPVAAFCPGFKGKM